ncbi:MAG: 3-hydroxybutyrate oligomer hydrolase family protein [Dokdonella sp.]|uniref:3-hydroxybutyrate oligomer hydrolase family protein n=1 Tax=Dokdonella sp. TaxID=2291710 RepID=UPI003263454B
MHHPTVGEIRETIHRDHDDLLTAGLGLFGLRARPAAFADPALPTPAELRRRSIRTSWQGIADLQPLGGYGLVYGATQAVAGREFHAFARLPGAHAPHRVLLQAPDAFDVHARCLLVAPSSGSRGVYGAIALAGAWGLPRGCAVVYTDKGTGPGYFDLDTQTGVRLDGTRAQRDDAMLDFEPGAHHGSSGVAVKHAHSGDHPEADWGRHVLQAAAFGLAMLDRAYPQQAPFTPANTRVIAVGLSNGGAAALQAAGIDEHHVLAGVVAVEPNVHVAGRGRSLFDYATEAALYLPCALADARFDAIPFARVGGAIPAQWIARSGRLREGANISGATVAARAKDALDRLIASGWTLPAIETAAATTAFDLWRSLAATCASAYLRASANGMPCGFRMSAVATDGTPIAADATARSAWWSDASGISPGADVLLLGGVDGSDDPTATGLEALRALWTGNDQAPQRLRTAVAETAVTLPHTDLPIIVVHGERDGLLPIAFSSGPYVEAIEEAGCRPVYWRVPHAQHFDAFLALPRFGERHVPLMPYAYAALDALFAHLTRNVPLSPSHRFATTARGNVALEAANLDRLVQSD